MSNNNLESLRENYNKLVDKKSLGKAKRNTWNKNRRYNTL